MYSRVTLRIPFLVFRKVFNSKANIVSKHWKIDKLYAVREKEERGCMQR